LTTIDRTWRNRLAHGVGELIISTGLLVNVNGIGTCRQTTPGRRCIAIIPQVGIAPVIRIATTGIQCDASGVIVYNSLIQDLM
jgi:hypothetical protein